jgi:hypothetical protein
LIDQPCIYVVYHSTKNKKSIVKKNNFDFDKLNSNKVSSTYIIMQLRSGKQISSKVVSSHEAISSSSSKEEFMAHTKSLLLICFPERSCV